MSAEPEELRDRVRLWLTWARDDLALVRSALADPDVVRRGACTWAHQCAEKALKAMVVAEDVDPPRTHNLLRLEQLAAPDVQAALAGSIWKGSPGGRSRADTPRTWLKPPRRMRGSPPRQPPRFSGSWKRR